MEKIKVNVPMPHIGLVLETTYIKTASRKLKVKWDIVEVLDDYEKMTLLEAGIFVI
jgi:hypothetical protein